MAKTQKFGIVGWSGERLQQFFEYCSANKLDPYKINTQILYVLHELKTKPELNSGKLAKAKSIEEAIDMFTKEYLRKSDSQDLAKIKKSYSYDALERFGQ